jgi:hypothetical protein
MVPVVVMLWPPELLLLLVRWLELLLPRKASSAPLGDEAVEASLHLSKL